MAIDATTTRQPNHAEQGTSPSAESSLSLDSAAVALLQFNRHELSYCISDEQRISRPVSPKFDQNTTSKIRSSLAQSPSATQFFTSSEVLQLSSSVQKFFDKICPLFPIICDLAAMTIVSSVISHGYGDNIETCLALLLVAIVKECDTSTLGSGRGDFQYALSILARVHCDFSLEFVQTEILAGIYLYRQFKLMEAWKHIHAGCTTLYVLIQR
ncbi:hypothetical protein TSTA_022400 [Talaromyces stipitatus ATCC 10500]|uniref:Transcription factor domain-containing protein n=1 Tax=Talaromyces stipitatus (strain ATCC 10500 / CBS 375.48 / QM 6759 / NRRL 1006) TaxID=441959 RepID=B8MI24_TALSN|nr:uncharacterized protein TSTA_022400 [Talaromyces stipitatus ATCC 10500]EED17186.1 hypothetical protein TSTA_022400 [Talaromyces stipitatus ATCC 10500]